MTDEVLVVALTDDRMKIGKSYVLLGSARTADDARALAASLPAAAANRVALLTKVAVIRRVPAVRLEDMDEDLVE